MSEKKKRRFSRAVVVYCLAVSTAVTAATLYICGRAGDIPPGTVTALLGLWGGELLLLCAKRLLADKDLRKQKDASETAANKSNNVEDASI